MSCRAERAREQLGLLLGLAAGLLFTMAHVAVKAVSGALDRDWSGADAATAAMRSLAFVLVVVAAALIPAPTRATEVEKEPPKGGPAPAPA